jgi:hypothetical protein
MLIKQNMVDLMINDNVASMAHNVKYKNSARVRGVPVIKQQFSAGYACIEMLSEYLGGGSATITEEMLSEANNGRNSASTNSGFLIELQKQFPEYKITQHKNLKNSEMIERIYESLANNMPVIFSYAAKIEAVEVIGSTEKIEENEENEADADRGGPAAPPANPANPTEENSPEWTMHYGIAVEIDLPRDRIVFNNPHGYTETYTINNFLKATRFENYENMEFYLKIGFAIEIFAKNTIYILEPKAGGEESETEAEEEPDAAEGGAMSAE